jgi:hypothetical protein
MKIIVCGDSFCASSNRESLLTGPRAHFSQILEDQYGYQVLNLAHGAMSNTAIWFQIEQAAKLNPDIIVYNRTWSSRLDLYVRDAYYNTTDSLKNFIYYDPCFSSSHTPYVGGVGADDNSKEGSMIISTGRLNMENSPFFKLTKEQITAVNLYFKYLYNDTLQTQTDRWIFEYWESRCEKQGIKTLCFNDDDIGAPAYKFSESNREYDSPFHTDRATQEIVAAKIHCKIVDSLKQ